MAQSNSPEIEPVSRNNDHVVHLRNTTSSGTANATTTRTSSYLRSIRNKRPSHFVLFILSTVTTLFNLVYHFFIFIITLAAFPLLLVALLATRFLQLVQHGDGYDKAVKVKTLIRAWIRVGTWLVLVATVVLLIVLLILKHGFNMTHVTHRFRIELLIKWSKVICMISGVYFVVLSSTGFLYLLPRIPLEHSSSGIHFPECITEIIECVIFLWAVSEVVTRIPAVGRRRLLYGLDIEKWIEVPTLVLIGHDFITLSTHVVAWSTRRLVNRHLQPGADTKSQWYLFVEELLLRQYLVYYTTGVRKSFSFILSSLLLLLTWVLYFRSRLDDKGIFEFGKWSCFSLVICALLWLIKAFVILSWEARVVYDRLSTKILEAGEVLYFLGVVGRSKYDLFGLLYEDGRSRESKEESIDARKPHLVRLYIASVLGLVSVDKHKSRVDQEEECWEESNGSRKLMKMSTRKRNMVRDELLMLQHNGDQTVYNVQQVAQYILAAKDTLSKEKYVSSILSQFSKDEDNREILNKIIDWKSNSNVEEDSNGSSTNGEKEEKDFRLDDWEYFEKLLKNVHPSEELSFLKFEPWMERTHGKCLRLANTLKSAKEVVDCLNKIMSGSIVSAIFIMWLLLTKLATTKVLVLIASPLLAATFIFGDTCKALFQGIIFIYVVHPFDVGDICVIGEKLSSPMVYISILDMVVWWRMFVKNISKSQRKLTVGSHIWWYGIDKGSFYATRLPFLSVDTAEGTKTFVMIMNFKSMICCEFLLRVVKAIGVWKTVLSKVDSVGTREEVIYPNSELAKEIVINHKTEFDWENWDYYQEFDLGSRHESNIADEGIQLKKTIINHLKEKEEEYKLVPSSHRVAVMVVRDNIKMAVRLKYKIDNTGDIQDWSYTDCLHHKQHVQAQFDLFMDIFMHNYK